MPYWERLTVLGAVVLLSVVVARLVDRRVKPLLPRIGKRLGGQTQAVLAAARSGNVEFLPDGSVRLAPGSLAISVFRRGFPADTRDGSRR